MITASLRSPTKNDATAVTASRISSGERNCRPSTGSARARCERTAFGPERPQPPRGLCLREALLGAAQPGQHIRGLQRPGCRHIQRRQASRTALAGDRGNRHQHLVPADALDACPAALPSPGSKVTRPGPEGAVDGTPPRR